MASLNEIYIKKEVIETILKTLNAKDQKGVGITISLSDETNQYGQNVSAYISQTKEQREAKVDRFFVGNGKTFWTDGKITVAEKQEKPEVGAKESQTSEAVSEETNDLPF